MRASLLALLFTIAAGLLPGLPARAQTPESPAQIIANIINRDMSLVSYEAHVDIRLHTGIPLLNPTLEGVTYFKRPDHYEVVFTKVPSYAKGFEKLYTDIGDPAQWDKRYRISVVGETPYNGHKDIVLNLVERVQGMIDHEEVLVDAQHWVVDAMTYHYYNGGFITLEQAFRNEGGFNVLSEQHATIALAHLPRATGNAHYSAYRFNVAIDDAVFTEHETKNMGVGGK